MTNENEMQSPSLAAVHHAGPFLGVTVIPCGIRWESILDGAVTRDWSKVTCGGCRLEMPEDMTGRPEYRVPADVKARDAAAPESIEELSLSLAAVEATYAMLSETIEHLKERRAEARAERQDLVRRLSVLRGAEKGPGVPASGIEAAKPAGGLSGGPTGGPLRYRVQYPAVAFGAIGTFLRRGKELPNGSTSILIRLETGSERWYAERHLQPIS